jgi:hypothetical protein
MRCRLYMADEGDLVRWTGELQQPFIHNRYKSYSYPGKYTISYVWALECVQCRWQPLAAEALACRGGDRRDQRLTHLCQVEKTPLRSVLPS